MSVRSSVRVDNKGLDKIRQYLKDGYYAKVGIVGDPKERISLDGENLSNAEVGMLQEFGTDRIPARSWLRFPIEHKQRDLIKFLQSAPIKKLFSEGKIKEVMIRLGIVAENIVQDAFDTGGFGEWAENSPVTVAMKGSSKPLIDTSQLRRAVTSEVVKKKDDK